MSTNEDTVVETTQYMPSGIEPSCDDESGTESKPETNHGDYNHPDDQDLILKLHNAARARDWGTYRSILEENKCISSIRTCSCGMRERRTLVNLMKNGFGKYGYQAFQIAIETEHFDKFVSYYEVGDESSFSYVLSQIFQWFRGCHENLMTGELLTPQSEYETNVLETAKWMMENLNGMDSFVWTCINKYDSRMWNECVWKSNLPHYTTNTLVGNLLRSTCTLNSKIIQELVLLMLDHHMPMPDRFVSWQDTNKTVPNSDYDPEEPESDCNLKVNTVERAVMNSPYEEMIANGWIWLLRELYGRKEHHYHVRRAFLTNGHRFIGRFGFCLRRMKDRVSIWTYDEDGNEIPGNNDYVRFYPDGDKVLKELQQFKQQIEEDDALVHSLHLSDQQKAVKWSWS